MPINEAKRCNSLSGKEWLRNSVSVWSDLKKTKEEKELEHPASFPVALAERLIDTFSKEGSAVLDPFNGVGSTSVAAENLKRKAIGIDLSDEYCTAARSRCGANSEIINGDSADVIKGIESDSIDLCLTSPPYWNILNQKRTADYKETRNYSDESLDLGNIDDYNDFLLALKNIFKEVYRVLKPKSYCLVNVMDLRKKSQFSPLHIDMVDVMTELGFIFDDLIIWDRRADYNNFRPLGYPYRFRINKAHEYILIFCKPDK